MVLPLLVLFSSYCLLCLLFVVVLICLKLDEIKKLLVKLDKPTREELLNKLTTTEAQKEAIRFQMLLEEQYEKLARILRNEIVEGFGGKK